MRRPRRVNTCPYRRLVATLGAVATLAWACTPESASPITRAEFGVLFGGQIQERTELPFELDTSRQALGFVVELRRPLGTATTLHWELSKPGPTGANRLPAPLNRRVELFDASISAEQTLIQRSIVLEPGDGLGMWNLRVTVGEHLAIDRAFMVYDAGSRVRAAIRKPDPVDAGL